MNTMIEADGLHKSYGDVHAVKGISFYVEQGRLFAFLGPNGAGKSTTIDMICTFLKPDRGEVIVDGHRLGREDSAIRASIGVVFQDSLLDNLLTVEENLKTRGGFYGLDGRTLSASVERAMQVTGVTELRGRRYGRLSGGQRRRCDIARALVHTPKILILDEPTTGLDPQTRQSVWETVTRLQKDTGMTVFLTTHYMEEAAGADYVLIIDDGKIAAKGTPQKLRETYTKDTLSLICRDFDTAAGILQSRGLSFRREGGRLVVPLPSTLDALPVLEVCRGELESFEVTGGTMDDAFIAVTGKELRE